MTLDLAALKTALALVGLLALLAIPIVWWLHRRSLGRPRASTEMWEDIDLMRASGGRRSSASAQSGEAADGPADAAPAEPEEPPADEALSFGHEEAEGARAAFAEEAWGEREAVREPDAAHEEPGGGGDFREDADAPAAPFPDREVLAGGEASFDAGKPPAPDARDAAADAARFPAFGDARGEAEAGAPLLFGGGEPDAPEGEAPVETGPERPGEDADFGAARESPGAYRLEEGAAPLKDEPGESPPPLPAPEGGGAPPAREAVEAGAAASEDDVFSLLRRERREENAAPEGAAPRGDVEEAEEITDFDAPPDFSLEEDAAREGGEDAPPDASPETPDAPSGLARELVAEACPGDLLLAESAERELPDLAADAADALRLDLEERQGGRRAPASDEYLRLALLEVMLGRAEAAAGHLKEALRGASRLGPVLNALAVASWLRGKADPAIAYCREALREAGRDAPLQAAVARNLGYFYHIRGEEARAAEFYEMAIERIGPQGAPGQLSSLRLRVGRLFRRLGEHEKARTHLSESARLFRGLGDGGGETRARVALAAAHTALGEHEPARASLEEALALCRESGDKAGEALVYGQMGAAYAAQEQFTRALRYYENALGLNRELENAKGAAANLGRMGNIHYARGDFPEAREAYEAALELGREGGDALARARVLRNLGRAHLEGGEWEAARARLVEARLMFQEAGAAEALESVRALERRLPKASGADARGASEPLEASGENGGLEKA